MVQPVGKFNHSVCVAPYALFCPLLEMDTRLRGHLRRIGLGLFPSCTLPVQFAVLCLAAYPSKPDTVQSGYSSPSGAIGSAAISSGLC